MPTASTMPASASASATYAPGQERTDPPGTHWRSSEGGAVTALLLLLLLPLMPAEAELPEIDCEGRNGVTTSDARFCASQRLDQSTQTLKEQLPQATLEKWKAATQEICGVAYAPYRHEMIFPLMILRCEDRLNRVLFEELKRLGE